MNADGRADEGTEESAERVRTLFVAAADLPAPERADYLSRACAGDDTLRAEVERLLELDVADSFLETPAASVGESAAYASTVLSSAGGRNGTEPGDGDVVPGTLLGDRYRVDGHLASGGMGRVFEGFDTELERPVAIKFLKRRVPATDGRLRDEARLLARLQHPNIVAVHEIGRHEERGYIVMDLVPAASLRDVLDRVRERLDRGHETSPRTAADLLRAIDRPLPEGADPPDGSESWFSAAARVLREVARAIEAAHSAGVLHRDLKPGNILLRGDGSPVVLDFGLAQVSHSDHDDVLAGSPAYIAPEHVESGTLGDDPRGDVYQLGLVLYELLTLMPGFRARHHSELFRRVRNGSFARPRDVDRRVPGDLESICLRAMATDPDERYPTAAELRADLDRFLRGEELPLAARSGSVSTGVRSAGLRVRRVSKRWAVPLGVVAAGLAVVLGVVLSRPSVTPAIDARWYRVPEGADVVDVVPGDAVRAGDLVGVTLATEVPQFVYVLSAFGQRQPPTWLTPMVPQIAGVASPERTAGGWGLRLPPGESSVHCTRIGASSADVPYEGLWVFVSEREVPFLEGWMRRLNLVMDESGEGRVALAQGRRLFETQRDDPRGDSPLVTTEEDRQIHARLTTAAVFGEDAWDLEGVRRLEVFFHVEDPDD